MSDTSWLNNNAAERIAELELENQRLRGILLAYEGDDPRPTGKAGRGKNQQMALDLLIEKADKNACMPVRSWRIACLDAGIRKERFNELIKSLAAAGAINVSSGVVRFIRRV